MLAIIIPYYKEKYFEFTLQSLTAQTDKRFTVYIGDDNSPDDCSSLIARYSILLNIKYYKFGTNIGKQSLVKQWERCYKLIENEKWLMFLGDDDILDENCIEEFYKRLIEVEELHLNVFRFSSIIINENNNHISHHYTFPKIERTTTAYINKAKRKSRASLSEHIFRRSALEQTGFIDMPEAWHTDDLIIFQISAFGSIYCTNEAKAFIRYSSQSVSGNTLNAKEKNKATVIFLRYLLCCNMEHFTKNERFYIIWYYFKKLKNFKILSINKILEVILLMTRNLLNQKKILKETTNLKEYSGAGPLL